MASYPSYGASCPLGTTRCIPQEKIPRKPFNKSFVDQVCSVKMARYWPHSFFASLLTSLRLSPSHAKKNLANIQPSWPHTWLITHTYISLPSSAKQHREMTKLCIFWRMRKIEANFSYFDLELNAGVTYFSSFSKFWDQLRLAEKIKIIALSSESPCSLLKFFNIRSWRWELSGSRKCNVIILSISRLDSSWMTFKCW